MSALAFTVLIPARLASSRLPNKPLADIAGKPMIVRVAEQAQKSKAAAVVVATDAEAVQAVCRAHGIAVVMTRASHQSGSDRLAEAVEHLGLAAEDIVVNVQGDEPLIAPRLMEDVAQCLMQRPDCVMSTAAHPLAFLSSTGEADTLSDGDNPHVVKVVCDARNTALYFSRARIPFDRDQKGASPLLRHMGIYAYRVGFLKQFPTLLPAPIEQAEMLEQLRVLWHGERIAVHLASESCGPGVDTAHDLHAVQQHFLRSAHSGTPGTLPTTTAPLAT